MTRRMADRRDQIDLLAHPRVGLHQIDQARIEHRGHRITEHRDHVLAPLRPRPVLVLDAPHQVVCLRDRRHPPSVDQHGVPADMVHVQMGAQHGIDRLPRISGGREIVQERPPAVIPGLDATVLLVVAEAGIDDDAPRRCLHHEAVDAHAQPALFIGEVRLQPGDRLDRLACRLRQDEAAAARHLQFDDLGHRHVADPPLHRSLLVPARFAYHVSCEPGRIAPCLCISTTTPR